MKNVRASITWGLILAAVSMTIVSCATLQDDKLASSEGLSKRDDLRALERSIVSLDVLAGSEREAAIGDARARLRALEGVEVKDTVSAARIEAWAGRLALATGVPSEARRRLERSVRLVPGDIPALTLSIRLEASPEARASSARAKKGLFPDSGELSIEEGRALLELKRYREAAVAFDAAFPSLPPVYRETYARERETAWSLRDTDGASLAAAARIGPQKTITWLDVAALAAGTPGLLDAQSSRDSSPSRAFDSLARENLLPTVSGSRPDKSAVVKRGEFAAFVWAAYAKKTGRVGAVGSYSARWTANPTLASPIPDVPVRSPWFDAVLGTVERELLRLPDGIRFYPDETVSGQDAVGAMRALR